MTGQEAVKFLDNLTHMVRQHIKDNTNKFWSYKMSKGKGHEFAFDPNTNTKLIVRLDVEPPKHPEIVNVSNLEGKSISTALGRVFSGGSRRAKFKATIQTEAALMFMLEHLDSV